MCLTPRAAVLQVSVRVCDGLQSSGQWRQTLGHCPRPPSAAGPPTGRHRTEIPENTRAGHTQVGQSPPPPGVAEMGEGFYSLWKVARAEGRGVRPKERDPLQDPAEPPGV